MMQEISIKGTGEYVLRDGTIYRDDSGEFCRHVSGNATTLSSIPTRAIAGSIFVGGDMINSTICSSVRDDASSPPESGELVKSCKISGAVKSILLAGMVTLKVCDPVLPATLKLTGNSRFIYSGPPLSGPEERATEVCTSGACEVNFGGTKFEGPVRVSASGASSVRCFECRRVVAQADGAATISGKLAGSVRTSGAGQVRMYEKM